MNKNQTKREIKRDEIRRNRRALKAQRALLRELEIISTDQYVEDCNVQIFLSSYLEKSGFSSPSDW